MMVSTQHPKRHKIIVGMSGGVDSSVAALLLQQQGYTVEGLFMKNWEEDDSSSHCAAAEDVADAQAICDRLNIPLHTINFAHEYWENVFEIFLREYRAGRTPNPDILCNKEIKFKCFLEYASHIGADAIATGHYARVIKQGDQCQLLKGVDNNKDQSYFLYALNQHQLSKALMPLGSLEKSDVRALAKKHGFQNFNKKDSTGICFIGERKFKAFLEQYIPAKPGPMIKAEGQTIGTHEGLMFYTIGQRQGLKIGGKRNGKEQPWYVLAKNIEENTLIVGQGDDHPLLFKNELVCDQTHWMAETPPSSDFKAQAKIRYRQTAEACQVFHLDENRYHVKFERPQRAITPGQSVVFYDGDICLGGGIIE